MNNWYFTAEELSKPVRDNGTPVKQAIKYRRQTCEFIQQLGTLLDLPPLTVATGFVYFHRFFALRDFEDYDRMNMGIACLFLAGKVEETPKKLKDFILFSHKILHYMSSPKEKYAPLRLDSPKYEEFREKILQSERIVMQTLAFDFIVEHPYKFVIEYVKRVNGDKELAQSAWNFVNDSRSTMLCLQYKPHAIACAAIYLASKRPQNKGWVELMANDVSKKDLDDISDQILELYPDNFPLKQQSKLQNNSGPSPLQPSPISGSYSPESLTLSPMSEPIHTPSPHPHSKSREKPPEPIPPPPSEEPPPPPPLPPPPSSPRYSENHRDDRESDRDFPEYSRSRQSPGERTTYRDYRRKYRDGPYDREDTFDRDRREFRDTRDLRDKIAREMRENNDRDRDLRDKISRELRDRDFRDDRDRDSRYDRDDNYDRDRDLRDPRYMNSHRRDRTDRDKDWDRNYRSDNRFQRKK